jgi:hypothetical protein
MLSGKVNYTNLSRYSHLSERTYRRHFNQGLPLESLNQHLIAQASAAENPLILVVDCTFLDKSGRHTHGIDWFYNGKTQRAEKGLEFSVISVVDVEQNTAYTLSAQQTEPGLSTQESSKSRIDFYLGHLAYSLNYVPAEVRYLVADAFYTKYKWVEGVVQLGLHCVGKLRSDANLKWLYTGQQKSRGRKRLYGDKVDLSSPTGFEFVEQQEDGTGVYTAVVWSVSLKRRVRVLYLCKETDGKFSYAVLFSSDTQIAPLDIQRFYRARFQIEFIFRDARQFTGLADCQARSAQALDSHVNASLTALNLAKLTLAQQQCQDEPLHFSMGSLKRSLFNEHLLELFICYFDLDPTLIKSHALYPELLEYGSLAS